MEKKSLLIVVDEDKMKLNEYLYQDAKFECLNIAWMMEKRQKRYQDVVLDMLIERKANDKILNKFIKNQFRAQIPFTETLDAIK